MADNDTTPAAAVSSKMPVPSAPNYEACADGYLWRNGRKLRSSAGASVYLRCAPSIGGVQRTLLVHRLVAEARHGPGKPGEEVCHINGKPHDNRPCNLRWDTRRGNHADKWLHGTMPVGSRCYQSKLTEEAVRTVMRDLRAGMPPRQIAMRFGVSEGTVSDIRLGRTWRHLAP